MKLGVSYNVFDAEELLEGSIRQIRDHVDYISVIYQKVSNFGNPCNESLECLLRRMKESGLVDTVVCYRPVKTSGTRNELYKRNAGLTLSRRHGCTHHMSMDCDEYYKTNEFVSLKNRIIKEGFDSSFCQMQTYYIFHFL